MNHPGKYMKNIGFPGCCVIGTWNVGTNLVLPKRSLDGRSGSVLETFTFQGTWEEDLNSEAAPASAPTGWFDKSEDFPFRICFVRESCGSVLPLQQCVNAKFEQSHKIDAQAWFRAPSTLVDAWEITPVSKYLDHFLKMHPYPTSSGYTKGPVRKFVQLVMDPARVFGV